MGGPIRGGPYQGGTSCLYVDLDCKGPDVMVDLTEEEWCEENTLPSSSSATSLENVGATGDKGYSGTACPGKISVARSGDSHVEDTIRSF